jgi:hypothetical protein
MSQYSFSLNGENWSGAFDTRESALAAAMQKCDGASDPPGTVFVGEIQGGDVFADHLGKILIDEMRARSNGAEGGGHLRKIHPEQLDELDAQIERVVVGWLQKHRIMPPSFKVEAISEHLRPVAHRGLDRSSANGNEVRDLGVGDFPA